MKEQIGCYFDEARTILNEIGYTKCYPLKKPGEISVFI